MSNEQLSDGFFSQSHREAVIHWSQQLQPRIHLWLSLLQQYQKTVGKEFSGRENEKHLSMIKSMTEIAANVKEALHKHLCSLLQVWIIQQKQQSAGQNGGALQRLVRDFLSLPARVVLKLNQEDHSSIWSTTTLGDNTSVGRKRRIEQSYKAKLVLQAVLVLEEIHKGVYKIYTSRKKDLLDAWGKSSDSTTKAASFHQSCTIDFLVGAAMALPSGQEVNTIRTSGYPFQDSSLRECLTKAVKTLTLFANMSDVSSAESTTVSKMITRSLGGALFVRVVDSMTALVSPTSLPENTSAQTSQRGQDPMQLARSKQSPLSDPTLICDALDSLHRWMISVPEPEKWQQVFPGTFKSLFQRTMDAVKSMEGTGSKIVEKALRSMNLLLRVSLSDDPATGVTNGFADRVAAAPIASLAKLQNGSVDFDKASKKLDTSSFPHVFIKRIREILPIPLNNLMSTLLVNQRKSASKANCPGWTGDFVELIEFTLTSSCWNGAVGDDEKIKMVKTTAMDALVSIIMLWKSNEKQCNFQKSIVHLQESKTPWSVKLRDSFSDRFASLLGEISVACLAHRQDELQSTLLLISGYVSCGGRKLQKQIRSLLKENYSISKMFQETMFQLYDVDFRRWSSSHTLSHFLTSNEESVFHSASRPVVPPWRYMNEECFRQATELLKALSTDVLGSKGTCMLIDRFIADFYDAAKSRAQYVAFSGETEQSIGYEEFVHCWTGALISSRYMVDALPRKAAKSLFALTKSVLPILLSIRTIDFSRTFRAAPQSSSGTRDSLPNSHHKGNFSMKLFLLELVHHLIAKIANNFPGTKNKNPISLLQECLFPLIESMVETSCRQLNEMARYCLSSLSLSCGFTGLPELIYRFRGNLFSSITGRSREMQRLTSKALSSMPSKQDIAVLPAISCAILNQISTFVESSHGNAELEFDHCRSLAKSILPHFDQSPQSLSKQSLLAFASFFKSTCSVMNVYLRDRSVLDPEQSNTFSSWVTSLERFKKNRRSSTSDIREHDTINDGSSTEKEFVTKEDTDLVSKFLDRSSHMMAHASLFVQVAGCQAILSEMSFLSTVSVSKSTTDETNGARTALLRHAADVWPMVISRLRSSWALVNEHSLSSLNTTDIFLRQSPTEVLSKGHDYSRYYVLIENLIHLATVLVITTGTFMASRFRDQIWPVFSAILLSQKSRVRQESGSGNEKVLKAILSCLSKIYDSASQTGDAAGAGLALSSMVPDVLSKTTPFLWTQSEEVFDLCILVFSSASLVDYDAVSTVLSKINQQNSNLEDCAKPDGKKGTPRVEEILCSIENLPEQELW